jgi:hypothetical protein
VDGREKLHLGNFAPISGLPEIGIFNAQVA